MSSFISAAPVASGQVQSLDSLRGHSLPSDAMIVASATQVNPTNQNTGSYALVESANALTLTTTGSVPVVTQSPFADLYKEGSIYFNGTVGNYVSGTATGLMGTQWNTTGLTVEAWVNYPTFVGAGIVSAGTITIPHLVGSLSPTGVTAYWGFGSNTLGYTTFYYYSSIGGQSINATVPLSTNTWNHIAFSCVPGGATANVYVNGVSVATASISGTPVVSSSIPLTLGQYNSGSPNLNCYVADVRITTGAALYTGSSFTVPSAPLSTSASGVCQALIRAGSNAPYVSNGALTFDRGLKQFQNYGPQTFNIVTQGFTAVWRGAFTGTAGNFEPIFQAGSTTTGYSNGTIALIRSSTSQTIYFVLWPSNSTTAVGQVNSSVNLTQGTTYIIAARYNPVTQLADIWINGVPGTPATITTASLVGDRTVTAYTGQAVYGGSFTSMTSNTLAVYNRALSNVEIYNSYLALNTVPATPQQKTLEIGDINGTPALSVAGNGQVSVQSIGLSSNVLPWPPAAMTGYDTVINGGVYKARASSDSSSYPAWYMFDKSSNYWYDNASAYSGSAPYYYTGAVTTTDVNGTTYKGEWAQIQLPVPITLSSYSISGVATSTNPSLWVILGSRDGVNWTAVNSQGTLTLVNTTTYTYTVAPPPQSYNFFRLVALATGVSSFFQLTEIIYYGTADTSPTLTIAPATTFNTSVATPSLTGIAAAGVYAPQDFSSSGLNIPAYVVSNTATTANTVAYTSFGPFAGEGSIQFQGGTGSFIYFPPSTVPQLNFTLNLATCTIEFWFFPTKPGGSQTIVAHAPFAAVGGYDWTMYIGSGNKLGFYAPAGGNPESAATVNYGAWNHAALSFIGGTVYLALNGAVTSAATAPTNTSTFVFVIGQERSATSTYTYYGSISNFRVVQGLALYQSAFTPPTQSLQPIQGTTQAGLPYGTVLLLRNAPAPGRIQTTKFSGANSGQVLSFPPAAMTSYATALNAGYGQGTYVASASSEFSTGANPAWKGFSKAVVNGWSPVTGQYTSTTPGVYQYSNATVDVTGTSYLGEWLQIQLPSSITLANYVVTSYNNAPNGIYKWWLLGSRDGTSWFLTDSRSGITWASPWIQTFTVASNQAFTYFRIVVNQVGGPGGANPVIADVTYNGSIESVNVTADGRVGLGVVNPTRALEVAGDVVCAGTLSAGNPLMFRNRIINGDMRINQRGATSFSGLSTVAYCFDRFATYIAGTGGGTRTINQVTDVPFGGPFFYSANVIYTAQTTGVVETFLRQGIELANSTDLTKTPITVSFWYKSNRTGTHGVRLFSNSSAISNMTDTALGFNVNNGNTWEYKVLTFGNSVNSSLITSASLNQLGISLDIGPMVSGQTSITINNNDYFTLTGVQLEKGTVATPFEVRPYATELALCQRYWEQSYEYGTAAGTNSASGSPFIYGSSDAGSSLQFTQRYMVPKRTAVTPTFYRVSTGATGTWDYARSGASGAVSITNYSQTVYAWTGAIAVGAAFVAVNAYGNWVANAEL